MTEETTPTPPADGASPPEDESLGDEVTRVVESAAELGLGAVIAPFTGGETVSIVGSVASMFEAGVDRLTHLGEHETPEDEADDGEGGGDDADADRESPGQQEGDGRDRESDREDDGGGARESDRDDGDGGDREDGGAAPSAPGPGPDTDGQATDGRG